MEDQEIEIISNSRDVIQVATVLQQFIKNNHNTFLFANLCINNRRAILWTALFQHIQNKASEPIHPLCLATLRVLSRDKTDLDNIMCEKWITTLTEKAGLYNFVSMDDETMINIEMPQKEIAVEALKCLCNIAFNSECARTLCASTSVAQGLVARLRVYKEIPYKDDIILFDMKLLFILTALRPDIKKMIKEDLHGMDYLTSCLKELVMEATVPEEEIGACAHGMNEGGFNCNLNDSQQAIACEILKTQFNLIMNSGPGQPSEEDEAMYLRLIPVLTALFHANCSSGDKIMDLHSNIANLLTSMPQVFFPYLTPELDRGEMAPHQCEGRNMDVLHKLLQLLLYKLSITKSTQNQYEVLSPILTVLNKGSRGCRAQRKYLRQEILPPLRDVSRPPEQGNTLRNQLCRFLTSPVTSVRDLVAELLFILCKEKVARFVKYTGFGNAAGHLAQKGLLAASRTASQYSSSSEDSDTEEYLEAQPNIDPVVGCTRPKPSNPFEGMTEEQKEYEAMKLVSLFERLLAGGSVKPARVGADGRPQPVQHVLEFREHAKDIPHP